MSRQYRKISKIIQPVDTLDGAGVKLKRSIGTKSLDNVDPFLLLDEFKSDNPNDYISGFPKHPHRGFETVSYMIHGNMKHADSKGNTGLLKSGGAQWLTAGRGVYHEEIPIQDNGLLWGFQLWVNLPAKEKMQEPKYQDYDAHQIPIVSLQNGIKVKIIAGNFQNAKGPVEGVSIQPTYFDIFLPAETELPLDIIEKHTGLIYVYDGEAIIQNEIVPSSRLVVFEDNGNCVQVSTKKSVKFIFITGKPIGEPIARHGPFVMNTREEIVQTLQDFNDGNF